MYGVGVIVGAEVGIEVTGNAVGELGGCGVGEGVPAQAEVSKKVITAQNTKQIKERAQQNLDIKWFISQTSPSLM